MSYKKGASIRNLCLACDQQDTRPALGLYQRIHNYVQTRLLWNEAQRKMLRSTSSKIRQISRFGFEIQDKAVLLSSKKEDILELTFGREFDPTRDTSVHFG